MHSSSSVRSLSRQKEVVTGKSDYLRRLCSARSLVNGHHLWQCSVGTNRSRSNRTGKCSSNMSARTRSQGVLDGRLRNEGSRSFGDQLR
jgi:hypothetical protein